jgi:hypothetical protein
MDCSGIPNLAGARAVLLCFCWREDEQRLRKCNTLREFSSRLPDSIFSTTNLPRESALP